MSNHNATVFWQRGDAVVDNRYSRAHRWQARRRRRHRGRRVASTSCRPRTPTRAHAVDPEEAFVAAIASCHAAVPVACGEGRLVRRHLCGRRCRPYDAGAAVGRLAFSEVVLCPRIAFVGERQAGRGDGRGTASSTHDRCFIANSVRCAVRASKPSSRRMYLAIVDAHDLAMAIHSSITRFLRVIRPHRQRRVVRIDRVDRFRRAQHRARARHRRRAEIIARTGSARLCAGRRRGRTTALPAARSLFIRKSPATDSSIAEGVF